MKSLARQLSETSQDLFKEAKALDLKKLKDDPNGLCSPQWYLHFDWEYIHGRRVVGQYNDFVFFLYPKNKDIWDMFRKQQWQCNGTQSEFFKRLEESGLRSLHVNVIQLELGLKPKNSAEQWTKLQKILTSISIKNSEEFKQDVIKKRNECHLNSTRLNELSFGLVAKHLNLN